VTLPGHGAADLTKKHEDGQPARRLPDLLPPQFPMWSA
jgi:hypothetical protein